MRKLLVSAALGALFASSTAYAQVTPVDMWTAATCVADNEPGIARALLATLPGSAAEAKMRNQVAEIFTACNDGVWVAGDGVARVRPAIAAAMVAYDIEHGKPRPAAASASPWYAKAVAQGAPGRDFDPVALGMQEFGTCVVAAAPGPATRLVVSGPGGSEERAAIAALKPALSPCVVQGKPITLKPAALRMLLAEPLYHAMGN